MGRPRWRVRVDGIEEVMCGSATGWENQVLLEACESVRVLLAASSRGFGHQGRVEGDPTKIVGLMDGLACCSLGY